MHGPLERRDLAWALAGLLAALVPCIFMWGFTVDDALISVRYARNLAAGLGYRFNAAGPSTDGVTPLPWAFILTPLAGGGASAVTVLLHAKYMGLCAWSAAAAALGVAVGRAPGALLLKGAALVAVALSLPVAAHAVSGMETALAMSLATAAALGAGTSSPSAGARACAVFSGMAAALRPEMAPWALVLALGAGWGSAGGEGESSRPLLRALAHAAIALTPFLICTLARLFAFGHPAPLSTIAKPSDLAHGATYTAAGLVVAATPALLLAPIALTRGPLGARIIVAAAIAHILSIIAVGGDWMPYARLFAPIIPSLAYAYVLLLPRAHRASSIARAALALLSGALFFSRAGPAGRHVMADRIALIDAARPSLTGAKAVAALDIGWVSAATDATIVDLAGLTDPDIAVLPGGHTSKHVDASLLLAKGTDALLFYLPTDVDDFVLTTWQKARYSRVVEARLARADLIAAHFEPHALLPLGRTGAGYLLLTRKTSFTQ